MFAQPHQKRKTFSRIVSWALLVFIIYGTTAEAAHHHGRVVPNTPSAASFTQTGNLDGSAGNKSSCNDCLICQLHQNVSTTLIAFRDSSAPVYSTTLFTNTVVVAFHSQTGTPQSGRAPPVLSFS
ncbi:MAG TPA: hypothetical protein VI306_12145 [Pyrinomonadaceae bacterium]